MAIPVRINKQATSELNYKATLGNTGTEHFYGRMYFMDILMTALRYLSHSMLLHAS